MTEKALTLALVAAALGLGSLVTVPAHAALPKTNFKNITYPDGYYYYKYDGITYHAKNPKKSVYLWNDTHTKKLYNLKNYPTYSWFQTAAGTYKGNSKWLKVTNMPGTKAGWVYRPQLTAGFNPKGYQITKQRYAMPKYAGDMYHVPVTHKNVYLWDWTHTKKVVNLKNYTNSSLYRRHSVIMTHNGKTQWYWYVAVFAHNKTYYGYVNSSQVAKGQTPDHTGVNILYPDSFVGTKDYLQYINQSKYQKLARAMVKLFPNTPVDLGLSQIAAYNYATNDTWDEDAPEAISTKGYTDIVPFKSVATYLMAHKTQTNAQKLAGVEKLLDKAGYTKAKRAKLTNYKLGIYILNNVKGGKVNEAGTKLKGNWYGLVIGKTE